MYTREVATVVATLLLMGLFFSPQHAEAVVGVERINIVNGTLTDGPFNPVFNGGEFNGATLDESRFSIIGMIDTPGFQVNLLGSNGISRYDLVTGSFTDAFNPVLSGGDFNGTSLSDLGAGDIAGTIDTAVFQVNLLGASGISRYDLVTGSFTDAFNPVLSGGDFNGTSLSDLAASDVAGMIDTARFQINLLGGSGISRYNLVNGLLTDVFNPSISGSSTVYNGQRFSDVNPSDILGMIDSHPFQVQLIDAAPVPEPATATLAMLGLGGLMMRRKRTA